MSDEPQDAADTKSIAWNRRTDAMFVAAYVAVFGLVYIVVFHPEIGEYAQGVITLVLGAFIGFLTAMYNYETGTTRGAQAKDATIKGMAEASEKRKDMADSIVQGIAQSVPVAAAAAAAAGVAAAQNGKHDQPKEPPK